VIRLCDWGGPPLARWSPPPEDLDVGAPETAVEVLSDAVLAERDGPAEDFRRRYGLS
jgi:hypothetical protein